MTTRACRRNIFAGTQRFQGLMEMNAAARGARPAAGCMRRFSMSPLQEIREFGSMKRHMMGILFFAAACGSFAWTQTGPSEFKGHDGLVHAVAFSNDGKVLATASFDSTVKLWDFATGKESQVLKGHTKGVNAVAFNKDGSLVATGSADNSIRLWNPKDGKLVKELAKAHGDSVLAVTFS